jgi:ribonuclease HI
MSTFQHYILNPLVAEAYAARQGVMFCRDLGFQSIQLEGDSQLVVTAIRSGDIFQERIGNLIEDIRVNLNLFHNWEVKFVRRDGREEEKREKYLCASRTACAAADATETQL